MTDATIPPESPSTRTPAWAVQPIEEFLANVENLNRILRLSMRGISMIRSVPQAIVAISHATKALKNDEAGEQASEHEKQLEHAKNQAQFAQGEVDKGFPLLHAQATVTLWGNLEALIHDFLAKWLVNEPNAIRVAQVQKLKIQLGDYESLDQEERSYYIIDLLERDVQFSLKQGVSRFEALLEIFDLGGSINESVRRDLFEMSQIRNVIVHRRGLVDRKLLSACPWLAAKIGDNINISHKQYERYASAVGRYTVELIVRVGIHFGKKREDFAEFTNPLAEDTSSLHQA